MPYQRTGPKPVKIAIRQAENVRRTAVFGLRSSQLMACIGLVLSALLFHGPASAQEEAVSGNPEVVDLEEQSDAPTLFIPPDPVRPYLDAIDRIEEEVGPYEENLSDLYMGLGEAYLQEGFFEEARDAYHRGVMVVRVNSGPNSPEQTNLLYLIANMETILDEPKSADEILENIEFINKQYFGETSPELLPVYERMYEWYHTVRPLDVDESEFRDYRRIIELTEEMRDLSEAVNGAGHPDTGIAYRRFAEANFEALRWTMNDEDWVDPRIIVGSDTPYQSTMGFSEISPREHYTDGRKAYLRYIEIMEANPSSTALERAEALADLADWSLHFEKYRAARKLYAQAYQVLAESEDYRELIDSYLGQPKPMQFADINPGMIDGAPLEAEEQRIDISMTITRIGDVRYVEILNPPEDLTEKDLTSIKRELQGIPFRPSLKDGKTVTTEGFIWQHLFRPEIDPDDRPEERTS